MKVLLSDGLWCNSAFDSQTVQPLCKTGCCGINIQRQTNKQNIQTTKHKDEKTATSLQYWTVW